ncbi:hypothetical protein IJT17_06210 [bacterium]|nr:hypothetical protein [bacterium]
MSVPSARPGLWLGIILGIGLAIRLTASYIQPAFLDEAFVYWVTKAGWRAMADVLRYDTHTPAYNVLMYPLVQLTDSMFWLRLPSVLLSLGTVWLSYRLARRYCSEGTALTLSAFISFSYCVWLTDAQLRSYSPLMFLCTSLWLAMSDIKREGAPFIELPWPRLRWPLFALASLLSSCIHVIGALMQGVIALFSFWLPSEERRRILICSALAILPCAAWFVFGRSQAPLQFAHAETREYWLQFFFTPLYLFGLKSPNDVLGFLGSYMPPEAAAAYLIPAYLIGNALIWAALLWGGYRLGRQWGWEGWFLNAAFLLPLLAILASCLLGLQPYAPRYAVTMTLPFLIALQELASRRAVRFLGQAALAWNVFICLLFPYCPQLWNQYWRTVTDFIDARAASGDIVCVYNPYAAYSFALAYDPQGAYYEFSHEKSSGYHVALRQRPDSAKLACYPLSLAMLNDSFLQSLGKHRIFLVLCQRYQGDSSLAWLNDRFHITDGVHFPSLTYWADAEVCILERNR